jgi:hypothetical protein
MREHIPAWTRRKIDEREARKNAPPVAAHVLGAVVNALGELKPEQHAGYLALLVADGKLTQAQADYVARVAGEVGL